MSDPIIKKLNNRLAQKISNMKPGATSGVQGGVSPISKFDKILDSKLDNTGMDKFAATFLDKQGADQNMEVIDANNIQINIEQGELSHNNTFNGQNTVTELFSTINNDALKMDSIIEVLSSSDTRLSRRQLLAYQASIGSLTINTEMFSKLAQSLSQNINTLLQTNMG